jgi:membrane-associated protein
MILLDNNFWSVIFNANKIIEVGGLLLLLGIIYIETGFFLGLVLPGGDYMIFAAGLFCGTQYLEIPLLWLLILLILSSFLGDMTGYFKGKWLGNKLFTDNKSRFFKLSYLERGKNFYGKYGIWAFVLGRFVPVIRTFVPMIAGVTAFPFRNFLFSSASGALVWVCSLVPLGYYIGKTYPGIIDYSFYILLFIVLVASYPVIKLVFSRTKP